MRGIATSAALAALLLPILSGMALPQEPVPESPLTAEPAAPNPKPRPKPKQKPAPKAEAPSEPQPETAKEPGKGAGKTPPSAPPKRPTSSEPAAESTPPANTEPPPSAPPSPSTGAFAALPIACEPGQSVFYDGPNNSALWVTRTGSVSVENPLRPLTPEVTRVLQIVVGGKLATAYGPDLSALRRGASPATLEGALGGAIRWDRTLAALPDTLNIVADSGRSIAELQFRSCGEAPAAAAPVVKADKAKSARKAPQAAGQAGSPPPKSLPPASAGTAAPAEAAAPRRLNLPQGAIPQ